MIQAQVARKEEPALEAATDPEHWNVERNLLAVGGASGCQLLALPGRLRLIVWNRKPDGTEQSTSADFLASDLAMVADGMIGFLRACGAGGET